MIKAFVYFEDKVLPLITEGSSEDQVPRFTFVNESSHELNKFRGRPADKLSGESREVERTVDDFDIELKKGFLDEAAQGVAEVEQCFLDLEGNPDNSENLNKIFRLAHNLKGSSKAVGFDQLGALTHEFETFILKVKNKELPTSPAVVDLLLRVNDFIKQAIEQLRADISYSFDGAPLIGEMTGFRADAAPAAAPAPAATPTASAATTDAPLAPQPPLTQENIIALKTAAKAKGPAVAAEENIRVSLLKVEGLINFVGELVILQSVMREQVIASGSDAQRKTMGQLEKVSKEIQELAMSLRMVPIKTTFQKMQRIVRDTAHALNKDVGIELVGEETELDKTVLEKLGDPLVHLVRNSVDHGIENEALRLERGKPARGQVQLKAYHQSGKLVIEVRDDGGGLDPVKLKNKAVEKGLLKSDATLSEREAFNLIFAPGFSTKEVVSDVSGRGVGMDVVKTNILDLGGEIEIESTLGKGTMFRIVLPLTLAIIDAMIVTYSDQKFVIPLNQVYENLQPAEKQIHHNRGMGDILLLRDENLPLFRLGDFFGLRSQRPAPSMIAMVVRAGGPPFAILVDDIIGQYQVVVKQLGEEIQDMKAVSGVTILGDGKPALILESRDLLKRKMVNGFIPPAKPLKGVSA